jgi:FkbM family methyltransferase
MKVYWTSEIYGFGKWIRKYAFYPNWLPLCIYSDHGISIDEYAAKHELESDAPVVFFYWHIKVKNFRETSRKPCYTLYSPFVFARKVLNIEQCENATGTVVFWAHSSQVVINQSSIDEYHQELTKIPEIFKPLTICLHMHDINQGVDKKLKKLGYKVVSAGNSLDNDFTKRFYDILSRHKYAISNTISSHTFYAVEMGIPFGLYGMEPKYFNYGDPNIEAGEYASYKEENRYKTAVSLFSGLPEKITQDQKEFVEEHLGLNHGLNRSEMALILYKSFFMWIFNPANCLKFILYCGKNLTNYLKSLFNKILDFSLRKLLVKIGIKTFAQEAIRYLGYNEIKDFIHSIDYKRITELPRYTPASLEFFGYQLNIVDNASFLEMTNELFSKNIYNFDAKSEAPYIIDCGANIGLSVLYFKQLYPKSQIVAIEADPNIFEVLRQNIESYKFKEVQCINSAVWTNSETLNFSVEGSWGGYLSSEPEAKSITVKALDLRSLIDKKIDFLKIDIEGAETEVLIHAQDLIVKYVDHLFFEWHSLAGETQRLGEILDYFSSNGFRYHIKEASNRETPFTNKPTARMDSQLDCFLYKV